MTDRYPYFGRINYGPYHRWRCAQAGSDIRLAACGLSEWEDAIDWREGRAPTAHLCPECAEKATKGEER